VADQTGLESRLLELISDVQGLLDLDEFREGLILALQRAIPSDYVSLNEVGPDPGDAWYVVVPPVGEEVADTFAVYVHQNPLVQCYRRTQDARAFRFSDVATQEELHETDLYREVYAGLGVEYQMAFTLPHEPPRILAIALSRGDRDYTDAERELANRARPYLIQAYRNARDYRAAQRAAEAGGALYEGLRSRGLTDREAEVIRLVALGRSNSDAAAILSTSVRTVDKHVQNALAKLGVATRSQAAALAWDVIGTT
jgi:DNA-binding CsgD family transcriptional regulator